MKKYLSILLLCAMLLGLLSACGSPAQTPAEPDAPAGQDTPAESETPTEPETPAESETPA